MMALMRKTSTATSMVTRPGHKAAPASAKAASPFKVTTVTALTGVPPSQLGESPVWHPVDQALYWCDIAGHALNRFDPITGAHKRWRLDSDVASCAPIAAGGMLLALRTGLVRFDTATGTTTPLTDQPPYDPSVERFNDGKADPAGRFWVGSMYEPRDQALAGLYCWANNKLSKMADGITISNGLAWSPDARTMHWADTRAHQIYAFDFDAATGAISGRRVFAEFAKRAPDQELKTYGGRPDGAAMDVEGHYWVAMYEGARVLRLAPDGSITREIKLPVRCPTMPCFGGADMKTLYITSARDKRSAEELQHEPLAGCVLQMRLDVPGLPTNMVQL